jgi:hypothetical protein
MITEGIILDSVVKDVRDMMQARLTAHNNIKHNLQLAQNRMKKNMLIREGVKGTWRWETWPI